MQAPQGAAGHGGLSQITAVLGWALQQLLEISGGGMPHQQQGHQLQQQQPSLLLDPDRFQPRALEGPWTQVSPQQPAHLSQLALLAQQMAPAGLTAHGMPAPGAAAAVSPPAAAVTAAAVEPQSSITLDRDQLSASPESQPEPTVDVGQGGWQQGTNELQSMPLPPASVSQQPQQQQQVQDRLGEHEGLDVLQPQQGQLEHARSPAAAAAAAAAGAQGTASCPVPSEPITSDSSVTGSAPHSYDDEGEAADTAEGASPAAVTAGVTAAAASAVPPNLRLGDPEVVSGKRAACCTIIRLSLTGTTRTLGTYSNDVAVLGDTEEDGALLPNNDTPSELVSGGRAFAAVQQDYSLLLLARLGQRRRLLGWQEADQEGGQGSEGQGQGSGEGLAWGDDDVDGQQSGGQGGSQQRDSQGDMEEVVPVRNARKQQHPQRKMRGPDPNLLLGSLLGGEGQDAQQQHEQQAGILSSFFQHMSAAGINIAAGAADRDPAQQDGSPEAAAAAAAAGGGGGNPAAVSALLLLVGEDVERMAQQWRAAEVPKLQACAADIWRSQHAKVDEWRQQLADQQARLDRACLRMADAHADAPEGYKKHRTTYCKSLEELVVMREGSAAILNIAQLQQQPANAPPPSPAAAAATAAAAAPGSATKARRRSERVGGSAAADGDTQSGSSGASSRDIGSSEAASGGEGTDAEDQEAAAVGSGDVDEELDSMQGGQAEANGKTQVLVSKRLSLRMTQLEQAQHAADGQQQDEDIDAAAEPDTSAAEGAEPGSQPGDLELQPPESPGQQQQVEPAPAAAAVAPAAGSPGEGAADGAGDGLPDLMDVDASSPPADASAAAAPVAEEEPAASQQQLEQQQQQSQQQPGAAEQPAAPAAAVEDIAADADATADADADATAGHAAVEEGGEIPDTDLSDEPEEVTPAASVVYAPPLVTVLTPEPRPTQALELDTPCELCVAAGGGVTLRWGKPMTVVNLPVWLSYQRCERLLELDGARQAARVQLPGGPLKQLPLGNIRPLPPSEVASLLPTKDILQHWQKQQQQQQQPNGTADPAAAAAAGAGAESADADCPLPAGAVSSWLSSAPGLHALSVALRPGSLLEYQRDGVWMPALVLHCSLAYSRQPDAVQAVLQQGFAQGAANPADAELPGQYSLELPPWQELGPDERIATLLLLNPGDEADVITKHVHTHDVTAEHCCLRRMLHWRPSSSTSPAADVLILSDDGEADAEDEGSSGGSASWQVLQAFPLMQLHTTVKQLLADGTRRRLQAAGWGPKSGNTRADAALLRSEGVLAQVSFKLGRRPTAAAVPQRLSKALGGSGKQRNGRWFAQQLPKQHKHDFVDSSGAAGTPRSGEAATQEQGGSSRQLGSGTLDTAGVRDGLRRKRKRALVLDDSEGDEEGPQQPKALKAPNNRKWSRSKTAVDDEVDEADAGDEAADTLVDDDIIDNELIRESQEASKRVQDRETLRDNVRRSVRAVVDAELPTDREALFDDEPRGPLNPILPKSWWMPGKPPAEQSLKPHQVSGLRFMWNCLVVEHTAAAVAAPKRSAAATAAAAAAGDTPRGQQADGHIESSQEEDDDDDDFIVEDDEPAEEGRAAHPINITNAGGCILAHSMGLGKSFQTVAMLWLFFQKHGGRSGRALVVVPTNVVKNWGEEFSKWLPSRNDPDYTASMLQCSGHKIITVEDGKSLYRDVETWRQHEGAVLILSFGLFSNAVLGLARAKKGKRQQDDDNDAEAEADDEPQDAAAAQQQQQLAAADGSDGTVRSPEELQLRDWLLQDPSIVVVDEAHNIKNPKSRINKAMCMVKTRCRLALTGYPLQNNMDEYFCMINWVQEEFMSYEEFKAKFIEPIRKGQERDATPSDKGQMTRKLGILQTETAAFIQRAGPEILVQDLPPKLEMVLQLAPTATQMHLLRSLLHVIGAHNSNVLRDTELFRKILDTRDHGEAVLREMVAEAKKGQAVAIDTGCAEDTSLVITPSKLQPGAQPVLQLSQEGQRLPLDHRPGRKGGRGPAQKKGKKQNQLQMTQEMAEALLAAYEAAPRPQQQQQGPGDASSSAAAAAAGMPGSSSAAEPALLPKEAFVLQLIRECCGVKAALKHEKVVVFSQSMSVLTALGRILEQHLGYVRDVHYLRLDGSTSAGQRAGLIRQFNRQDLSARVFLISTRAGSVGINLVSARHLVLYDLLWNPVHNKQAVSRVWRYGQQKPCFIYHLMYAGTFETRVFERVLVKEELFQRVVEKANKKAKLADKEIDLYHLQDSDPLTAPELTAAVDRLFSGAQQPMADEAVLTGLVGQARVVRELQLVSLTNHAEQMLEDPSKGMTKEEKQQLAIENEIDRRHAEQGRLAAGGRDGKKVRGQQQLRLNRLVKEFGRGFRRTFLDAFNAEKDAQNAAQRRHQLQEQLLQAQREQQQLQGPQQPQQQQQQLLHRQQQLQAQLQQLRHEEQQRRQAAQEQQQQRLQALQQQQRQLAEQQAQRQQQQQEQQRQHAAQGAQRQQEQQRQHAAQGAQRQQEQQQPQRAAQDKRRQRELQVQQCRHLQQQHQHQHQEQGQQQLDQQRQAQQTVHMQSGQLPQQQQGMPGLLEQLVQLRQEQQQQQQRQPQQQREKLPSPLRRFSSGPVVQPVPGQQPQQPPLQQHRSLPPGTLLGTQAGQQTNSQAQLQHMGMAGMQQPGLQQQPPQPATGAQRPSTHGGPQHMSPQPPLQQQQQRTPARSSLLEQVGRALQQVTGQAGRRQSPATRPTPANGSVGNPATQVAGSVTLQGVQQAPTRQQQQQQQQLQQLFAVEQAVQTLRQQQPQSQAVRQQSLSTPQPHGSAGGGNQLLPNHLQGLSGPAGRQRSPTQLLQPTPRPAGGTSGGAAARSPGSLARAAVAYQQQAMAAGHSGQGQQQQQDGVDGSGSSLNPRVQQGLAVPSAAAGPAAAAGPDASTAAAAAPASQRAAGSTGQEAGAAAVGSKRSFSSMAGSEGDLQGATRSGAAAGATPQPKTGEGPVRGSPGGVAEPRVESPPSQAAAAAEAEPDQPGGQERSVKAEGLPLGYLPTGAGAGRGAAAAGEAMDITESPFSSRPRPDAAAPLDAHNAQQQEQRRQRRRQRQLQATQQRQVVEIDLTMSD